MKSLNWQTSVELNICENGARNSKLRILEEIIVEKRWAHLFLLVLDRSGILTYPSPVYRNVESYHLLHAKNDNRGVTDKINQRYPHSYMLRREKYLFGIGGSRSRIKNIKGNNNRRGRNKHRYRVAMNNRETDQP